MPTAEQRYQLAKALSAHLVNLAPELDGKFQCPTCMRAFNIHPSSTDITAAHILPEAAGGKKWTLLCEKCNKNFGKSQDKWFGEYLNVLLNEKASFLDVKTKSKYIEVNGEKVSGRIFVSNDDTINIILPTNHNPPGKVDSLCLGPEVEIKFVPELVKHELEISLGYLTAAYLMWFDALGYNWIYQSGLDVVREQILNPNEKTWKDFVLIELNQDELVEPGIAIVPWRGGAYAASVIYDRIVIFPPPEGMNMPKFKRERGDKKQVDLVRVDFRVLSDPYILSYEDMVIVLPNMIRKDDPIPKHMLRIPADTKEKAQWLFLIEDA